MLRSCVRGSGLGRVLHSQVEAVSPFGVFFVCVHVFDMASERAERAFMCAFRSVHAVFGARLRKTVLTKYSSG